MSTLSTKGSLIDPVEWKGWSSLSEQFALWVVVKLEMQGFDPASAEDFCNLDDETILGCQLLDGRIKDALLDSAEVVLEGWWGVHRHMKIFDGVLGPSCGLEPVEQLEEPPRVDRPKGGCLPEFVCRKVLLEAH